ncbi:peptidase inhibitor family I36 protein [Streptomyces sp. NBC_01077]|uniref:peptidase inhibitor family I36 protein n=1 Tax=Streptomyces sp. NBC_01077 TaxID=2903746 RepID=UPI003864336D
MIRRLAATVAAAFALVAGVAGTSHAAEALDGNCESGEFCVYRYEYYAGGTTDFAASRLSYKGLIFGGTLTTTDNHASSSKNRSTAEVTLYAYANYGGPFVVHSGVYAPCTSDLCAAYTQIPQFDNVASSHEFTW